MHFLFQKARLLTVLAVILIAGFLTTAIASYEVSKEAMLKGISEQSLPLTSDTIYSDIQRDLVRPIFVSSTMAHDTFLRDWVLHGEHDSHDMVRYLREIKEKYNTITAFFVSDRTSRYYYAGGILKKVSPHEPRDKWFYRVRDMQQPYETNVDIDMANRDALTVFINYRVLDFKGNFIGATGVGLTMSKIGQMIDSYQKRFHRRIYFTDKDGNIKLASSSMAEHHSIREMPGIRSIADQILSSSTAERRLEYQGDKGGVLVNSRYLKELNLFLIVEQNENRVLQPVVHMLWANLGISAGITVLVLLLALYVLNHYQRHLEKMATVDQLTQIYNRQTFEVLFERTQAEAQRSHQPLSVLLIDADLFKHVNDTYGHLEGDRVLRSASEKLRGLLRDSDVIARWGGEEFIVLLRNCKLQQALAVAEKLRQGIAETNFGLPESITVSIGVSEYHPSEDLTAFFARVDAAMYEAKQHGRNQVVSG